MSKHTPTKLTGDNPGSDFNLAIRPRGTGFILASLPPDDESGLFRLMGGTPTGNMDRLVDCWNAFDGVEDPQAYLADLLRRIGDLEAALELREQQWQELTMAAGVAHYGSFGSQIHNANRRSDELAFLRACLKSQETPANAP